MAVLDRAPGARVSSRRRPGVLRRAARTTKGRIGLALTGLIVLLAVIGPFVTPYSPTALAGLPYGGPTGQHLLGTDGTGRDVLSRVLAGGWELLVIAVIAAGLGVILGALGGLAAAYWSGWVDALVMRSADVMLAFPQLVFVLLLVSVAGPATWLMVLAIAISQAPTLARVIRASALEVCEQDFVRAVQLWRPRSWRVILGELLPNVSGPLLTEVGLRLTYAIMLISGLSFLGFGIQPPTANWALMISENRIGITANVWAVAVPAILIGVLTVGLNTYTDAVADVALGGAADPASLQLIDRKAA